MKKTVTKRRQLKFDEIHALVQEIGTDSAEEYESLPVEEKKARKEKFWDCLWDFLLDGWAAGLLFVGEDKEIPDLTEVLNYVYPRGESVSDIYDKDITDKQKLETMVEAECNRVWNTGVIKAGEGVQGLTKTWETMLDDRVRDTHFFLQGETIPYDEEFVTIGGDSALAPGMFENASENCNCRCFLSLGRNQTDNTVEIE